jgi:IS5 family transposase
LIKIQEAENQIVTDYEVCHQRPADSTLFIKSIEGHQQKLGRVPHLAAADAGFYSEANEKAAYEMGVKRVSMPNRSTKSAERRHLQKKRWFRKGQPWRTGCEGRISVLKRRHGLNRCRYRGDDGMKRWVGLGSNRGQFDQHRTNFGSSSRERLKKSQKRRTGRTCDRNPPTEPGPKRYFCAEE